MEEKENDNSKPILQKDSLFALARKLYQHRKLLLRSAIIGTVVGILFAIGVQKEWTAQVVLVPETEESGLGGKLGGLASLAGINMAAGSSDALYPELYPQMIEATPFIVGLFDVKVTTLNGEIETTFYDYIKNHQKRTWTASVAYWMRQGIKAITSTFIKSEFKQSSDEIDPFYLSIEQDMLVESVRKGIVDAFVNKSDMLITLSVTTQDPLVSATLVDSVRVRLQQEIINYRTQKARHDMEYYAHLVDESRAEYKRLEQNYADYADTHQNPFLTSVIAERDDLENQMQIAYEVYSQMVQQYELSKAKVQEATPSFTILQPSSVPIKPSSIPKIVVMLLWIFVFVSLTALWILLRDTLRDWKIKITSPEVVTATTDDVETT
ncbi:MAG: chain-length determining protein [Prevotellaceae bacterium]|nr:chain-length determining protein [Prevotellaceae bacterium]